MRVKVYCDFEEALDPVIEADRPIDLVIDYGIPSYLSEPKKEGVFVIFATIQPEGQYNNDIINNQGRFDILLTFIPELLKLPKARFFIGTTAFCTPGITDKIFGVSAIFSGRNCLPGHKLRFELWRRRHEIKIPRYFYVGDRTPFPYPIEDGIRLPATKSAKNEVMKTMFHIAIDSYDYPNSFSEKLIDPLITGTIPIYWGPDDIYKYFKVVPAHNVDDIIEICNGLTPEFYYEAAEEIRENYESALYYHNYADCLQREIDEICERLK